MSNWSSIKNFINSKNDNEIIYRRELIKECNFNSIDTIRRSLTLLGFLKQTDKQGTYIKIKNIPDKFNTSDLKCAYKNKRYKFK